MRDADQVAEAIRTPPYARAEQEAVDRRLSEVGAERLAVGTRALTHRTTGALATGAYATAAGVLKTAYRAL